MDDDDRSNSTNSLISPPIGTYIGVRSPLSDYTYRVLMVSLGDVLESS